MKLRMILAGVSALLLTLSCKETEKLQKTTITLPEKSQEQVAKLKTRLEQATYMLEGSFTSEAQHNNDPLAYYNIIMHIYPIWKERTDAKWFYVEQALATLPDEPYRQRIYKMTGIGRDTVVSTIYTLPDPGKAIGAWKGIVDKGYPFLLNKLKPSELTYKEGCDVYLTQISQGVFGGSTRQGTCVSDRKDSRYTMSDVNISLNRLSSWDRGYDERGVQVWGPDEGYRFDRMTKDQITEILDRNRPKKEKK